MSAAKLSAAPAPAPPPVPAAPAVPVVPAAPVVALVPPVGVADPSDGEAAPSAHPAQNAMHNPPRVCRRAHLMVGCYIPAAVGPAHSTLALERRDRPR